MTRSPTIVLIIVREHLDDAVNLINENQITAALDSIRHAQRLANEEDWEGKCPTCIQWGPGH